MSSLLGMLLGLAVGLRHAFEPDHLTAIATLATEARGAKRGAMLGALWGIGHTASLVIVGLVLLAIGAVMPVRVGAWFELGVCAMLVVLGIRAIVRAWKQGGAGPVHAHSHGAQSHVHAGVVRHVHLRGRVIAVRPLLVGLVHGLAGSGALTALVFAELHGTVARVAYISLFGAGSVIGMAIASALVGASVHRLDRGHRWLGLGAGALSVVLGIAWSLPLWPLA
ncbi:MAG TPA: hypothetical protein VGM39_06230 [Kofleriaceae bacterium]|jgi:hypothetical protein